MGLFSTKKNKSFDYKPRYYKGEGNPFKMESKYDNFRTAVGSKGLKNKVKSAVNDYKTNKDSNANKRVVIIALILIFIFFAFIGFDLSIFFPAS